MFLERLALSTAVILCVAVVDGTPVSRLQRRGCPGGLPDGAEADRGEFWLVCNNGYLEMRGCYAQNRTKILIGQTHIADGLETRCSKTVLGEVYLRYEGCRVAEGRERHAANDFWNDEVDGRWYFCEQRGARLRLNVGGCLLAGRRVAAGSETVRDGVVWRCLDANETTDAAAAIHPVGCMHYAKRYDLGTKFEDSEQWFACELTAEGLARKRPMGCVHGGERLVHAERFVIGDVILECVVDEQTTAAVRRRPVGCVQSLGSARMQYRMVGSRWTAGHAPYRYRVECEARDDGATEQRAVACAYATAAGPEIELDVGCFAVLDGKGLACQRRADDHMLMFAVFDAKFAHLATELGLRSCHSQV